MAPLDLEHQEYANRLYSAYEKRQAFEKDQIPESIHPRLAYELQQAVTAKKAQNGEALAGYKISLTSPETQQLFSSEKPLYGALTAPAISGNAIELSSMLSPLIEIELMFLIQEDIDADDSTTAILEKPWWHRALKFQTQDSPSGSRTSHSGKSSQTVLSLAASWSGNLQRTALTITSTKSAASYSSTANRLLLEAHLKFWGIP